MIPLPRKQIHDYQGWWIEYRGEGIADRTGPQWHLLSAHAGLEAAIQALVQFRKDRMTPGGATVEWHFRDQRTIDQIRLRNPKTNEIIPEEIIQNG